MDRTSSNKIQDWLFSPTKWRFICAVTGWIIIVCVLGYVIDPPDLLPQLTLDVLIAIGGMNVHQTYTMLKLQHRIDRHSVRMDRMEMLYNNNIDRTNEVLKGWYIENKIDLEDRKYLVKVE